MANEVDDFLGSMNEENQEFIDNRNPLDDVIDDTEAKDVQQVKEEKSVPFHKDPKVQRFIEKEIAKRLEKVNEVDTFKRQVDEDEDDYYVRLIGNDTPEKVAMIREAKAREEKQLQLAEERAFNRLSKAQQDAIEAKRQADEQLTNAIEDIEETFNVDLTSKDPVAKKTRVDFMKFVEKIAPKNRNGEISEYPDMVSAFETWKDMRRSTQTTTRAKDIASRSMGNSGSEAPAVQEKVTFENLDGIFDRMFRK